MLLFAWRVVSILALLPPPKKLELINVVEGATTVSVLFEVAALLLEEQFAAVLLPYLFPFAVSM
jgi:hypothetical protein